MMYHLNLMEMLEQPEFPQNPNFPGLPRNMVHSWATNIDDETIENDIIAGVRLSGKLTNNLRVGILNMLIVALKLLLVKHIVMIINY